MHRRLTLQTGVIGILASFGLMSLGVASGTPAGASPTSTTGTGAIACAKDVTFDVSGSEATATIGANCASSVYYFASYSAANDLPHTSSGPAGGNFPQTLFAVASSGGASSVTVEIPGCWQIDLATADSFPSSLTATGYTIPGFVKGTVGGDCPPATTTTTQATTTTTQATTTTTQGPNPGRCKASDDDDWPWSWSWSGDGWDWSYSKSKHDSQSCGGKDGNHHHKDGDHHNQGGEYNGGCGERVWGDGLDRGWGW